MVPKIINFFWNAQYLVCQVYSVAEWALSHCKLYFDDLLDQESYHIKSSVVESDYLGLLKFQLVFLLIHQVDRDGNNLLSRRVLKLKFLLKLF